MIWYLQVLIPLYITIYHHDDFTVKLDRALAVAAYTVTVIVTKHNVELETPSRTTSTL